MVRVTLRAALEALAIRMASVKAAFPGPATLPKIRALASWLHDERFVTADALAFTSCASPRNAPLTAALRAPAAWDAVSFGVAPAMTSATAIRIAPIAGTD